MKKTITTFLLALFVSIGLTAQIKVGYFTEDKAMTSTNQPANDPIVQMLELDANVTVDVQVITADAASGSVDLTAYDVVVFQEPFSSGATLWTATGLAGLGNVTVPFIYNKAYALRNGKAVTDADAAAVDPGFFPALHVSAENQANELFSGISFETDSVVLFNAGADDFGGEGAKAMQYVTGLDMDNATTLIGSIDEVEGADAASVCLNDIPSGTKIGEAGSEVTLQARMIAVCQNYGAICNDGNMTAENLTLWRNAVYSLAGQTVPTTLVDNTPAFELTSNVGTMNVNANANAFQLTLAKDVTTATIEAVVAISNPTKVNVPTVEGLTNGTDTQFEFYAFTPIGNDSVLYTLDVHVQAENEILYVSADSYGVISSALAFDTNPVNWLKEAGYSVTFVAKDAIKDDISDFDYTPFSAIVIGAGTSSSNITAFSQRDYPVPCVTMQPDAARGDKWGWVNNKNAAQFHNTKAYNETTCKITITDDSHYITKTLDVNDVITWTNGTASDEDWSGNEIKTYNLTDSIPEAIALAKIPAGTLNNIWAIPAGVSVRSKTTDGLGFERRALANRVVLLNSFNNGFLYASDDFAPLLTRSLEWVMGAELTKVGYFTMDKAMTAKNQPANDPIVQMLKQDHFVSVDVQILTGDELAASVDMSSYDLVIFQEPFSSGATLWTGTGLAGLENIPVPFIYNKAYALRNDKAVTDADAAAVDPGFYPALQVAAENQSNDLFKGISFEKDSIVLFNAGADDSGGDGAKAMQFVTGLDIDNATTLLGTIDEVANSGDAVICFNDVPAGTKIGETGSEVTLQARMIAICQNYGAICNDGNMTDDNYTLWRNAVYSLAGLEIPETGVVNAEKVEVTADAGQLTYNANAKAYQLTLAKDVTSANLSIVTGHGTDDQLIEGLTNGSDELYEYYAYKEFGYDSVMYTLDVHVQDTEEILYVSADGDGVFSGAKAFDSNPVAMLREAGYSVTFADKAAIKEWTPDGIIPFDYTPYAAMVIGAGTSSGNITDFSKRDYPVPCVSMQGDAPKENKWGWINSKNAEQYDPTKVYDETTCQLTIKENRHYITNAYDVDQVVTWTTGTATDEDFLGKEIKTYDLTDSISEAISLGAIAAGAHSTLWAVPAGASVRSRNADDTGYERRDLANRIVILTVFNDGLLYASDDFAPLLSTSLEWALGEGEDGLTGFEDVTLAGKGVDVSVISGNIVVKADEASDVTVVAIDGTVVAQQVVDGTELIPATRGLYVVVVDGTSVKVMVTE